MNDRAFENLEQFDVLVKGIGKGRGGAYIFTDRGCKLFLECDKPASFYLKEDAVTRALVETGYRYVDTYFHNKEGQLFTEGADGKKYVMKNWFDGRECDVKCVEDVVDAAGELARLHKSLNLISGSSLSYNYIEDESMRGRRWDCMADSVAIRENEGEIEPQVRASEAAVITANADFSKGIDVRENCKRHAKEIKKAGNYMKSKKRKNEFEQMAVNVIDEFLLESEEALEFMECEEIDERFSKGKIDGELAHNGFNYHNVFFLENNIAVTNFDRVKNECQIVDLYQFLRKIMEKYNWDVDVAYRLIDEYDRVKPLADGDLGILIALLKFPEKFWKVINQYYNAGKAWIPAKNIEKLNTVIRQNSKRREFIDKICGVC